MAKKVNLSEIIQDLIEALEVASLWIDTRDERGLADAIRIDEAVKRARTRVAQVKAGRY